MSNTEEAMRVHVRVIERGSRIYEEQLKARLEPEHKNRFVAIEPETGRYFLGDDGSDALLAAHEAMPESQFYLKRIGCEFTYRLGFRLSLLEEQKRRLQ